MQFLDKKLHIKDNRKLIIFSPTPSFFFGSALKLILHKFWTYAKKHWQAYNFLFSKLSFFTGLGNLRVI